MKPACFAILDRAPCEPDVMRASSQQQVIQAGARIDQRHHNGWHLNPNQTRPTCAF